MKAVILMFSRYNYRFLYLLNYGLHLLVSQVLSKHARLDWHHLLRDLLNHRLHLLDLLGDLLWHHLLWNHLSYLLRHNLLRNDLLRHLLRDLLLGNGHHLSDWLYLLD